MAENPLDQETLLQYSFVLGTAVKLLLIPTYRSTDFEVHRNWLAVTHSLPLSQWYYDATSQWTLDYPPFFAYFEYLLSQIAQFIDPEMLKVRNLEHASPGTIYFQRLSVLVSELVLYFAIRKLSRSKLIPSSHLVALSIFLSPGFLIVDHMHFQYNGMMYGILIYSMIYAKSAPILAGFLFSVLLCFKHIYLYLAPAYFIYLLRVVVIDPDFRHIDFGRSVKLGVGVLLPALAAFGPFIYLGQISQVFSRLFPFNRGLCHAYWAPNFWALYSFVDRLAIRLGPYLGLALKSGASTSATRGLVADTQFAWLPEVSPRATFAITLSFQVIALTKLFLYPTYEVFLGVLTLCGFSSFFFGWHVHEKAVLLVIIPASFLAMRDRRYFFAFRPLLQAGYASLLPLIFTPLEIPIALTYTLIYLIIFLHAFGDGAPIPSSRRKFLLDRCQQLFTITFVPLMIFNYLVHPIFLRENEALEFLPLMLMSTYCAWGILWSWFGFNYLIIVSE